MQKIRASCSVIGDTFSPAIFAKSNQLKLAEAGEPGEIGTLGRYRGIPTPYGHATIEVSNKPEHWSHFDELLTIMENCVADLRKAGAEEISMRCSIYDDVSCNFGFSHEQLKRMAALKIDVAIDTYANWEW